MHTNLRTPCSHTCFYWNHNNTLIFGGRKIGFHVSGCEDEGGSMVLQWWDYFHYLKRDIFRRLNLIVFTINSSFCYHRNKTILPPQSIKIWLHSYYNSTWQKPAEDSERYTDVLGTSMMPLHWRHLTLHSEWSHCQTARHSRSKTATSRIFPSVILRAVLLLRESMAAAPLLRRYYLEP